MNVSSVMQYHHYDGDLVLLSIKAVEKMLIFVLMGKTHSAYFYLSLQLPS